MLAASARHLASQAAQASSPASSLQQLLRGALCAATTSSSSSLTTSTSSSSSSSSHSFASSAAAAPEYELAPRPYDVPEGHAKSDLSPHVCNIGLNRRRDLTLRADVMLYGKQATGTSLASLFKGKRCVVFGVPNMGSVCANAHVPSYVEAAAALGDAGVDRVFCVASAAEPVQALAWGAAVLEKANASGKIETLADRDLSFARMLGVDAPAGSPVPAHRYAALVEDGILLKLKVEADPAKCDNTRGDVMLQCAKEFFHD